MAQQTDKEIGMSDYMKQGMIVNGMIVGTVDEVFNMKNDHIGDTNKMVSAVDWLIKYIERENWSLPQDIEKQAKQMEKKQHRHTWLYEGDIDNASYERFERYYQVTFGGQGSPDTSPKTQNK